MVEENIEELSSSKTKNVKEGEIIDKISLLKTGVKDSKMESNEGSNEIQEENSKSQEISKIKSEPISKNPAFSPLEFDALKETANIGTGHAAIALSNILKKKVNISLPDLKVLKLSEASSTISFPEGMIVGIHSKMQEGFDGSIIMMMPFNLALDLVGLFSPKDSKSKNTKLDDKEKKLLMKLGTAIYISYLSSLAKFFEKKIYFDPPKIVSSFGDSIFDFMSLGVDDSTEVLIIKLGFEVEKTTLKGDFLLLLTVDSLSELLSNLKTKV